MNIRGWLCIVVFTLLLSGCVSGPKHRAYDRVSAASLKSIEVLPMRKSEIELFIVNNPGYSFGLIGVAIAEANRAPKSRWLKSEVSKAGFDPTTTFTTALDTAMRAEGYELAWSEPRMEPGKPTVKRDNLGLRKSYSASTRDAILDVNFGFNGYASAGSSDKAPYRPTVVVSARLLSADGKRVLFEDHIIYNSVFPHLRDAITINPDDRYRYPDFDDLEAAGATAVEGLAPAFTAVAEELAKQLKR